MFDLSNQRRMPNFDSNKINENDTKKKLRALDFLIRRAANQTHDTANNGLATEI